MFIAGSIRIRNGIVVNNLFLNSLGTSQVAINPAYDSLIANNIFYGSAPAAGSVANCTYNNNISLSPYNPGSGNDLMPPNGQGTNIGINNINDQDPLLTAITPGGTTSWDFAFDLRLQSGSPGKNAGTDGTDMGVYGGTYPWDLEPAIPIIETFNTSAVVPQGTNLSLTVKANAN